MPVSISLARFSFHFLPVDEVAEVDIKTSDFYIYLFIYIYFFDNLNVTNIYGNHGNQSQ